MTLSIFEAAEAAPDRPALITHSRCQSFAELAADARRAVAFLAAHGVSPANPRPVAVIADSSPEIVALLHALIAIGAPALLVHPRLTPAERARLLDGESLIVDSSWTHAGPLAPAPAAPSSDRRALAILFSSGTTGAPKRVTLSRAALSHAAAASQQLLGDDPDDRWLACLPLAHVGGFSILIRCLLARRALVLTEPTDPASLLALAHRERVTLASFVPTQLARLLELPSFSAPQSLRAALIGGAAASPALLTRARTCGIPALASYGLSEASGQVATQRLADPSATGVGPPLPGIDVRLLEGGRIAVRGPTLANDLPLSEGWYLSDDLGRFDDRGRLSILGRISDRIVTGGENVDPLEVEQALERCPGVARACVFGVGDALWGQRVAVAVVAAAGFDPKELAVFCRRELAAFKRPRLYAELRELCQHPSGKLDRGASARSALAQLKAL